METEPKSIHALVREMERDYSSATASTSKYVSFSMHETISRIDAYINSTHISGDTDYLGREKPFFNIVTAACNIWQRATDIDRKNIRIKATAEDQQFAALIATQHIQAFMRREAFGKFLNDWGRTLARYGSAVSKFVRKDGRLIASVVPWNMMICDQIDFEGNVKIQKLELTPAQLRKNKSYDQEAVRGLLDALTTRKNIGGQSKDSRSGYVTLYEVHGELDKSLLTGKESDSKEFVQQMHVIASAGVGSDGNSDDFTLYKGREESDPFMISHLIREDGRTLGIGAVEHLFEAQWMVNHSQKAIKDQLDLASKLIFQTSDGTFAGQNALSAIESGDILIHKPNQPLTAINNMSHDVSALQDFAIRWKENGKEITSTPEAISGGNQPSGTAYRTVAILNQESHSLFELMTENKGLAIEDMMRIHVIPFVKTKMNTKEQLAATLESNDIAMVDSAYVRNSAISKRNDIIKAAAVEGRVPSPYEFEQAGAMQDRLSADLRSSGSRRYFSPDDIGEKTWKESLEGLEWEVEVEVTNETTDKEAVMTTLTTLMQTIAANPAVLSDPTARMLFNKILTATGQVSPAEIPAPAEASSPSPAESMAPAPQEAQPLSQT